MMPASPAAPTRSAKVGEAGTAVVWIDSREAIIVRMAAGEPAVEVLKSDVPVHRRATGHVRHDPALRHGGGLAQCAADRRRLEHLRTFLRMVARRLPVSSDLVLLGPGTVHELLDREVRAADERHGIARAIRSEAASHMTVRQIVARLRRAAGSVRQRTVGAYRWTDSTSGAAPGIRTQLPRRMVEKRRRPERSKDREGVI